MQDPLEVQHIPALCYRRLFHNIQLLLKNAQETFFQREQISLCHFIDCTATLHLQAHSHSMHISRQQCNNAGFKARKEIMEILNSRSVCGSSMHNCC